MSTKIAPNAERGAAFLDEILPGWHEKIDVQQLALSDNRCCVLAQLADDLPGPPEFSSYRPYFNAKEKLGLSDTDCAKLGFYVWPRQSFARLTSSWKLIIEGRRS